MKKLFKTFRSGVALAMIILVSGSISVFASSHQDAPLVIFDPAANTTDVYAFVVNQGRNGVKSLVVALGVWPFEEPGIGPNKFNFDDNVRYEIHLATGNDVAAGRPTLTYRFEFETTYKNSKTILQSYLGVIQHIDDANQNLTQTYTVTKVDERNGRETVLGTGKVPPNNQGNATPFYNQGDSGENAARMGVSSASGLDRYTSEAITTLRDGYVSFAGQRDDGFSADIQAVFDLLKLRQPGKDAQGGFNIHLMALEIPVSDIGGDMQIAGVYATTARPRVRILQDARTKNKGEFVQVARQGNPLFNEALVAIEDKDLYSRTSPNTDGQLFRKYAETPELAMLINALVLGSKVAPETNRSDIAAIFIPDLIKVDLSTAGVRFAGNGSGDPSNPDDPGFSRLGIFGGDVLQSRIQDPFKNGGLIPGGWPNGRRFGDDVVDIAVSALLSDLRNPPNLIIRTAGDGVDRNDMGFNKTFPYESTPQNGRIHSHP
jgi:hypothetical protein